MAVSIYGASVEAYRDTTKWLAALTPATTLVTAAAVLVGPIGASLGAAANLGDWLAREWDVLVCGIVVLIAVGSVLAMASRVLSVEPTEIAQILAKNTKERPSTSVEKAIGDGILAPDFYTEASFTETANSVHANLVAATGGPGINTEKDLERLRTTFETLREWKVFVATRMRFVSFIATVTIATAFIAIALGVAWTRVGGSAAIGEPTEVSVVTSATGAMIAEKITGCTNLAKSTYFVIAGTWAKPVLTVRGTDCIVGNRWQPNEHEASVVPAP